MSKSSSKELSRWLTALAGLGLAMALGAVPLTAQQGAITGQVVDATTLEGLEGVQVFIPGSDIGGLTDEDGSFRLTGVPAGTQTVRTRLIGYRQNTRRVEVRADETVNLTFELAISAVSMEEVVVTATGEQERRELGNAVSTVDASSVVENQRPNTLNSLLKGNATGVSINRPSGSVGAASSIKIRGNSSLGLSTVPVVYVDGARINNDNSVAFGVGGQDVSRLDDLNPDDIASVEVIKGPAAAALYGTEASAGVIRITTKRGTSGGGARYNIRTEQGASWDPTAWWSMAWASEGGLDLEIFTGVPAARDTVYVQSLLAGTRFARPFRTGHQQTYAGSVRGGDEGFTYFLSGEFDDREGNLQSNSLDAWNARANFNVDPSETVDISVSTGFTSKFTRLPENDNNLFSIAGNALGSPWWGPMTAPDPNAGGEPVETCFLMFELARATGASLRELSQNCDAERPFFVSSFDDIFARDNEENLQRFIGSGTLTWRPLEYLTNRFTLGYDESQSILSNIVPVDPTLPFGSQSEGFLQETNTNARNLTLEGTSELTLDLTEDLRSQTTVGAQFFDDISEVAFIEGRNFPAGSPSVNNSVAVDANDAFTRVQTAGLFVQEQLSWKGRIFLTPAIRFDDNSAFGENLDLQEFPQVHGSWVVSEEEGFPDLFDQLRLRVAWGESGKQPGPNDALALLNTVPVRLEGADVLGFRANRPGNADLQPETGEEWEVGFDAALLDGRLDVEFTYYDQTTENAIVQRPLAPSIGFPGEAFVNVAEIANSGIEVGINATAMERDGVTWDWGLNFSTNDNEITELPEPIGLGGAQQHREGHPFGAYFAESVTVEGGEVVVGEDAEFQGHPTPEWQGSLSSTLTLLDRITLHALADFAGGHHLENNDESFSCGLLGGGGLFGSCPEIFQRGPNGEFTDEARIKQTAAAVGSETPFIQSAEFLRLSSASLRFRLPQSWLRFASVESASLQVQGENLALWTAYPGLDPEMNAAGSSQASFFQFIGLPPDRSVTATLSLSF